MLGGSSRLSLAPSSLGNAQMNLRQSLVPSQFIRQSLAPGQVSSASGLLVQDLLQFGDLSTELSEFANRLDLWIAKQTEHSIEQSTAFKKTYLEEQEKLNSIQKSIDACKAESERLVLQKGNQDKELRDNQQVSDDLNDELDGCKMVECEWKQKVDRLRLEVERARAAKAKREQEKAKRDMEQQPMLDCCHNYLGLYIQPLQDCQMKFTFTCIDPKDWSREFWFIIDLNQKAYSIVQCYPEIEDKTTVLDQLNQDRMFGAFLIRMRKSFVSALTV